MPSVNVYKCNTCDLKFPVGWGGYIYVENDKGERVICMHPGEDHDIQNVLGVCYKSIGLRVYNEIDVSLKRTLKWWWSKKRKDTCRLLHAKTGYMQDCLCLDCLQRLEIDLIKDQRVCNKCHSTNVKSLLELLGGTCPQCKEGIIVEIPTGWFS
jgi:hypothetical protein